MIFYRFVQALVRAAWPLVGRVEVRGLEHIPPEGAFLLVANHQSYLDPILIQSAVRRPVHAMAKSTQFSARITGAILKRLKSFPVRRFETDPQAVRLVLRRLAEGQGVGIYAEGERTWDGRLQPPRLGVLRLILKAGVPVVPCGISGTYDAWPRWDRRIRRAHVIISIGAPLRFPQLDRKPDRERALPQARDRLMDALAILSGSKRGASASPASPASPGAPTGIRHAEESPGPREGSPADGPAPHGSGANEP